MKSSLGNSGKPIRRSFYLPTEIIHSLKVILELCDETKGWGSGDKGKSAYQERVHCFRTNELMVWENPESVSIII